MFVLFRPGTNNSLIAQTTWYKYPGNPVFQPGKSGEWDWSRSPYTVLFDEGQYHMWYKGWTEVVGSTKIGYASSPDGIHWQKYEGNPLDFTCEDTSWDTILHGFEIIKKDSMYWMWYIGVDKKSNLKSVGFAWSEDGLNWTKHPEPVLWPGREDEWDGDGVDGPTVYFDGIRYRMWYNGVNKSDHKLQRIGYATSDDGILWKKHPANPVLDVGGPGAWDEFWIGAYSVNFNGSFYEIWYDGWDKITNQTGSATSIDGVKWIKCPDNPVLQVGELGTWDTWVARIPAVVCHDSVYKMWYLGHDEYRGSIGYATTSVDEAKAWDTATINKPQRIFKVQLFNRIEYINVDSLIEILPELSDIEFIDASNKLALAYSLNDSKKSLDYAEKALELSDKENYPEGKAMALYSIGNSQYILDNYSEALASHLSALWLFDSLGMQFELGNLLCQIAGIHSYAGSQDLSCRYYKQALDVFERLNDTGSIMNSLIYLGYSYLSYGDTAIAIKPFRRRLYLAKAIRDKWMQAESYEALGLCYSGHNLDSALYYFNEANKIWNTFWPSRNLGYNYLITAEAYVAAGLEYFEEAENYFFNCFPILAYERYHKVRLYLDVAELYFTTGRYDRSKEFLDHAMDDCQILLARWDYKMFALLNKKLEAEIDLKLYMEKIYRLHYRLDTVLHNEGMAFKHFILASQWKDSIYNEQNRKKTAMMQGTFEIEATQNHMGMLQKENEVKNLQIRQSRILLFGMGAFVVVLIFMAFLFIRQNRIRAEHKTVLLEQKLLRLQMNPHFIFNAISNIMNFIENKNTDKAIRYLAKFSSLLRSTLETTRKDYIILEDEVKGLTNYLELQKLRYGDILEYIVDVDEKLDTEEVSIPPMLIQPFIENAIDHGIRHKNTTGHIGVRFLLKGKQVVCEVEDDGVGRAKAWEIEFKTSKKHKSLATDIITDRIQAINKKMKHKIRLDIIDIKSIDDMAIGTKVVIGIPI